jgi:EAL and modified HD-GYP domain-containing signal transduction protein
VEAYYLGRQPIFDRNGRIFGYELLYRHDDCPHARVIDGAQATSQVIINGFWELGLGRVVGRNRAFVNLTRDFLLNPEWLPPPSQQLVLEVMEEVVTDKAVVGALCNLRRAGYTIALDDFTYRPDTRRLLDFANIVKLDVQDLDAPQLDEHYALLRQYPVELLAEKVETPVQFDRCRDMGFDYYQGYFLCKPRVLSGKRLSTSRLRALELMAALQRPELEPQAIENLISQDPGLAFRLLRYINSPAFPATQKIHSIHHAIIYLGEREIRRWANLVILTGLNDKPGAIILTALVRARMCELLAGRLQVECAECAFMVGLFSVLDAMLDQPLKKVLSALPFAPEIVSALLNGEGQYAPVFDLTLAYERGNWSHLDRQPLARDEIVKSYLEAVVWAESSFKELSDAPPGLSVNRK